MAQASIPKVIAADLLGNVTADVVTTQNIKIGKYLKKITDIRSDVIERQQVNAKHEIFEHKFKPNLSSKNVLVFTSVVSTYGAFIDEDFIVVKNCGYDETRNRVYMQAMNLLGPTISPYSVNVLAIEYSD